MVANGDPEQGYEYYQHAVDNYPETYDAYSALLALLDAEQLVDDLQRGLVNYFRGQYDLADEAFTRYLQSDGDEKDKALYYQALTARAKGLEMMNMNSEERLNLNQQGRHSLRPKSYCPLERTHRHLPEKQFSGRCDWGYGLYTANLYE